MWNTFIFYNLFHVNGWIGFKSYDENKYKNQNNEDIHGRIREGQHTSRGPVENKTFFFHQFSYKYVNVLCVEKWKKKCKNKINKDVYGQIGKSQHTRCGDVENEINLYFKMHFMLMGE